ncbi:hypothetical protein [Candidatus Weimeria sp. HCP3S3_B5]|uniref:hypothetical protein n=1 Tax=Candidatus Weimeria sp. HCP3S3_B5 TaxID=3438871 RepID=UPI003F8AFAC9
MGKIDEAREILKKIGMPSEQQNDMACLTLLTLAGIKQDSKWSQATNEWIRIHDVLQFASEYYDKVYAENTRETIRKSCMHQFREAALIEDNVTWIPGIPTYVATMKTAEKPHKY